MRKVFILVFTVLISNLAFSQTIYTFNGNGNWNDSTNWLNREVPPVVPAGNSVININPSGNGECIINVPVRIPANIGFNVLPGKKLKVLGNLSLHYDSTVVLNYNVHVIDSNALVLVSSDSMLAAGVYKYIGTSARSFANDDILVGLTSEGYLRKVTSYLIAGNVYTFQTSQGNMEDVFKQGYFDFAAATDSSLHRAASSTSVNGYTFDIDDIVLFDDGVNSIKLTNGSVILNPNWRGAFDYGLLGLNLFELAFQNASVESNFKLVITSSQAVGLPETTKSLKKLNARILIPGVPIVVVMSLDFLAKYSWQIQAAMTRSIDFNYTSTINLGVKYKNGNWENTFDIGSNKTIADNGTTANINATIKADIIPTFSFKFYGIVGPYAAFAISSQTNANIVFPSLNWDFWAGAWLKTSLGVNASILGRTIYNSPTADWYTDTLFYKTPYSINRISGNNQTGQANQFLTQPIKVRVLDNFGIKQKNVSVNFKIKTGGGILQKVSVLTDDDGYAQTLWKLGSRFGIQYMEAAVTKANGTLIENAPVEFAATIPCNNGSMTPPVITDVQLVCNASNRISILVSFTANGTGALINGGSGYCDPSDICYPTRLYFLNPGATDYSISYNGYYVTLKSGNSNAGVIEITLNGIGGSCVSGLSALESLKSNWENYMWKVELMNHCNQRSNQIQL